MGSHPLSELLADLPLVSVQGNLDTDISSIVYDSRKAVAGSVFVAQRSPLRDGHDFVDDAYDRGCRCFIIDHDVAALKGKADATVVAVAETRQVLAIMAARWFGHPAEKLTFIALTGTKGKTTISFMLKAIFDAAGRKAGLIGSNGVYYGSTHVKLLNTTPESFELHKILADMVAAGMDCVILEATSQGFMMHRTDGIRFDVGLFTNISPDHISATEHACFEDYLACKKVIFSQTGLCFVNRDDPLFDEITAGIGDACEVRTYGFGLDADWRARDVELVLDEHRMAVDFTCERPGAELSCRSTAQVGLGGSAAQTDTTQLDTTQLDASRLDASRLSAGSASGGAPAWKASPTDLPSARPQAGSRRFEVNQPGVFNASNALAAICVADAVGVSVDAIAEGLKTARVGGRMELVDVPAPYTVLIDFAHNKLSMEALLETARAYKPKRILMVFGLEGDRAHIRRFDCGRLIGRYCDHTILSDASPRMDDPDQIIADIAEGIRQGGGEGSYEVIRDRHLSIPKILDLAEAGDLVLLVGKGDVRYEEVRGEFIGLDEREIVRDYFARR